MKKIGILILVLGSLVLFAQISGDEIKLQNTPLTDNEIDADKIKIPAWKPIGPKGGSICSMAFNPKNNKEIFAIMYGYPGSVYYTQNSGKNWKRIAILNASLYEIAVDPKNPRILYAVYYGGIYKSEDGGKKWKEYGLRSSSYLDNISTAQDVYADKGIAIDPQNSKIIYVGGHIYYDSGNSDLTVFKSEDGGKTWIAIKITSKGKYAYTTCIAINPKSPSVIYAGGYYSDGSKYLYRVFKSNKGGNTWKNISGIIDSIPYSIVIDPKNPSKVYVGASDGVYRSSNGGQTWTKNQGYISVWKLAIDSSNPNTLYAGGDNRCYKSTDGGVDWTEYDQGLQGSCAALLIPDSSTRSGLVYAQSSQVYYGGTAGFYKSTNGGVTWKASVRGMNAAQIPTLAVAPSNPNIIYAEVGALSLFKSTKSGKAWKRLPDFDWCWDVIKVTVDPENANNLFVLAGNSGKDNVYRSVDGGNTMELVYEAYSRNLAVNPNDFKKVYVAGYDDSSTYPALHLSNNGGKNWTERKLFSKNGFAQAVAVDPKNDNIIYVGGYDMQSQKGILFKSINGGKDWTKIGEDLEEWIHDIAVDPVSPSILYVGTPYGVYKSVNSGASWTKTDSSFDAGCLKINPNSPKIVFAAGEDGIYYSNDKGNKWVEANKGLGIRNIRCLDWDLKNKIMYAGSHGGSIYKNNKLLKKIK